MILRIWYYVYDITFMIFFPKNIKLARGGGASQHHSGGRGRWASMSLRPAWSTKWIQDSQGYTEKPCLETHPRPPPKKKKIIKVLKWRVGEDWFIFILYVVFALCGCNQCLQGNPSPMQLHACFASSVHITKELLIHMSCPHWGTLKRTPPGFQSTSKSPSTLDNIV
jgi:hypothetical protein